MPSSEKMFTVDRFLGLNQEADGQTELPLGQSPKMENFTITDDFNLKTRPAVTRVDFAENRASAPILAAWAGHITEDDSREFLAVVDFFGGTDRIFWYYDGEDAPEMHVQLGALGLTSQENHWVKIFAFGGILWIFSRGNIVRYNGAGFQTAEPYIPLVIVGASPAGGGTELEKINLLSAKRRVTYSCDGSSKAYVLPDEAQSVNRLLLDNTELPLTAAGGFNQSTHTFTFQSAPIQGVGNLEITYSCYAYDAQKNREAILSMPLLESYNGSTDTRLFAAGNGNVCYYSGVTETGEATPLYFPAMNDVKIDMTGAAVTGLVRHYGKLLVFTYDGTYSLSYEPVTLAGGDVTAGFYLRPVNREYGSDILGQVQVVENKPRTVTNDGIYEWNVTSSYQDERYARRVSGKVQKSLRGADLGKIVTCDDSFAKTYYVFLGDDDGTVLVNRYALQKEPIWCLYRCRHLKNIRFAFLFHGQVHMATDTEIYCFSDGILRDSPDENGDPIPIFAYWESGHQHFGADFRRKFSSEIYVSLLPEGNSQLTITAQSDKRGEYAEKVIENNVLDFSKLDFSNLTFSCQTAPKIRRARIKVKKFVYYKLIFKVDTPNRAATILGYDQKVRYGSMAK